MKRSSCPLKFRTDKKSCDITSQLQSLSNFIQILPILPIGP